MKVLEIVAPAQFGGLERVIEMLAQGLHARGHDVSVLAVLNNAEPHPFVEALRSRGLATWPVVLGSRSYRRERAVVRRVCREFAPGVAHTHGYRADVVDSGTVRSLGIPVVSTLHGFTGGDWKNRCYERIQRWAVARLDAVVAVSRPLADTVRRHGMPPARLHVIPNAFQPATNMLTRAEARRALGVAPEGFVAGWVGRVSSEKGPDLFLKALERLTDIPVTGCLIGDGPDRPGLEGRTSGLAEKGLVRWCGALPEAARYYAAFDCFVLSSRTEGTPIVLFEAMEAGIPIVATVVGGVPDVIDREHALLVAQEAPTELATAVRQVHDDPIAARARAARARARLDRDFTIGPWLDRYEALFRSLAAGRGAVEALGSQDRAADGRRASSL